MMPFVFDFQSWDVSMVLVLLRCTDCFGMCACLPAFAVGVGSSGVCMFHVLILHERSGLRSVSDF